MAQIHVNIDKRPAPGPIGVQIEDCIWAMQLSHKSAHLLTISFKRISGVHHYVPELYLRVGTKNIVGKPVGKGKIEFEVILHDIEEDITKYKTLKMKVLPTIL